MLGKRVLEMANSTSAENKNIYRQARDHAGFTREEAVDAFIENGFPIKYERIERIETDKFDPTPDEVYHMAQVYKMPELCNFYCTHQYGIGKKSVPEIKMKELSQIILGMLASLNSMQRKQERLIEITEDGEISDDELKDFIYIQKELDRISMTVKTLKLWSEQQLAIGKIDKGKYEELKNTIK